MEPMKLDLDFLKKLLGNIHALLGDKCELVVHDFRDGKNGTIVHIVNGELSGRTVNNYSSNLVFDHIHDLDSHENDFSAFFNVTEKGRVIKSSATYIRDESQTIIGAICINWDITDLVNAQCAIQNATGYFQTHMKPNSTEKAFQEKYFSTVDELFDHYLAAVEMIIGKEARLMSKEEKEKAIKYLHERGLFKVANASVKLCKHFGISKYTLYNYLGSTEKGTNKDQG